MVNREVLICHQGPVRSILIFILVYRANQTIFEHLISLNLLYRYNLVKSIIFVMCFDKAFYGGIYVFFFMKMCYLSCSLIFTPQKNTFEKLNSSI